MVCAMKAKKDMQQIKLKPYRVRHQPSFIYLSIFVVVSIRDIYKTIE